MPGMLDEIRKKHARLRGRIDNILAELEKWKLPQEGKVVGLNLPPSIRGRLDRQCLIWGAMTTKQIVGTCIALGLREIEEIGNLLNETKTEASDAPIVQEELVVAQSEELPEIHQNIRPEIADFLKRIKEES